MNSAATTLAPEPQPTLARLWALMVETSGEIAETRRIIVRATGARGGHDDDLDPLVLSEGRLSVLCERIDELAAAVAVAGLAPAPAAGPVAVPGRPCVPPQRANRSRPLMAVVRP